MEVRLHATRRHALRDTSVFQKRSEVIAAELRWTAAVRRFWQCEDGVGMVEFAFVGTLFSVIVLGILEFGVAVWQKNSAAADAREGARYAVVRGGNMTNHVATADSVQSYVRSKTSLDAAGVRVYTTWTPDNTPGSVVKVSVAHTVPRRGPFIRAHVDSATTEMTIF